MDNPGDVRLFEEVIAESDLEAILHVVSTEEEALEFIDRCDEENETPCCIPPLDSESRY